MKEPTCYFITVAAQIEDGNGRELADHAQVVTLPVAPTFDHAVNFLSASQNNLGDLAKGVLHLAIWEASEKIREEAEAEYQKKMAEEEANEPEPAALEE